jgi:hypothetical protein
MQQVSVTYIVVCRSGRRESVIVTNVQTRVSGGWRLRCKCLANKQRTAHNKVPGRSSFVVLGVSLVSGYMTMLCDVISSSLHSYLYKTSFPSSLLHQVSRERDLCTRKLKLYVSLFKTSPHVGLYDSQDSSESRAYVLSL